MVSYFSWYLIQTWSLLQEIKSSFSLLAAPCLLLQTEPSACKPSLLLYHIRIKSNQLHTRVQIKVAWGLHVKLWSFYKKIKIKNHPPEKSSPTSFYNVSVKKKKNQSFASEHLSWYVGINTTELHFTITGYRKCLPNNSWAQHLHEKQGTLTSVCHYSSDEQHDYDHKSGVHAPPPEQYAAQPSGNQYHQHPQWKCKFSRDSKKVYFMLDSAYFNIKWPVSMFISQMSPFSMNGLPSPGYQCPTSVYQPTSQQVYSLSQTGQQVLYVKLMKILVFMV